MQLAHAESDDVVRGRALELPNITYPSTDMMRGDLLDGSYSRASNPIKWPLPQGTMDGLAQDCTYL